MNGLKIKRIIFLCIAAIMLFNLISCGDTGNPTKANEPNEPQTQETDSETQGKNVTFLITDGDNTHTVSMDDLLAIGGVSVSSSPRDVLRNFTGVPLAGIFNHFNIDYSSAETVSFTSLDGFMSAVTIAEALDATNTFIVFEEDGEALGTMEDSGRGPFMVVVALDPFANRWARYLTEVTIQ
jgi:hypothetical protein